MRLELQFYLVLGIVCVLVFSKVKSKLQKQDAGEDFPFQKSPYECDGKATRLGNFVQQKIEISKVLQLCSGTMEHLPLLDFVKPDLWLLCLKWFSDQGVLWWKGWWSRVFLA